MATIETGDRIGKGAKLSVAVNGVIFNAYRDSILLIKRTDNGMYCLPGGRMEPGESLIEAVEREVWEETGLRVKAGAVLGVGSNPNLVYGYPDGNRWQVVEIDFECVIVDGKLTPSNESSDFIWYSVNQALRLSEAIEIMYGEARIVRYLDGQGWMQ